MLMTLSWFFEAVRSLEYYTVLTPFIVGVGAAESVVDWSRQPGHLTFRKSLFR